MRMELTEEEVGLVMRHRAEKRRSYADRASGEVRRDCKHLTFDSEGEHCEKDVGFGVGNHCFACHGKVCEDYARKK